MTKITKVLGIDEAGRGAVIGPLVICGALIGEDRLNELVQLKVKDSKLLSGKQRDNLAPKIRSVLDSYEIAKIGPHEIDDKRNAGISETTVNGTIDKNRTRFIRLRHNTGFIW